MIGEGLASDQTSTLTFGLGEDTQVKTIDIALADGSSKSISNPKVNTVNRI